MQFSEDAAKLRQWQAFLNKNRIEALSLGATVALLDDLLWPASQVAGTSSGAMAVWHPDSLRWVSLPKYQPSTFMASPVAETLKRAKGERQLKLKQRLGAAEKTTGQTVSAPDASVAPPGARPRQRKRD